MSGARDERAAMPAGRQATGSSDTPAARHAIVGHTADAGIEATSPDVAQLFEEAALALSEMTAAIEPGAAVATWEDVTIEGRDLEQLAFGWLNELIGLVDSRRSAVAAARVDRVVEPPGDGAPDAWRLEARVALSPYDGSAVRALRDVKAATYHGLRVERRSGAWCLRAYLDV
jgi:SHS2 domain-containing protein